jgi:ATP-binding cassette subfamily C protein
VQVVVALLIAPLIAVAIVLLGAVLFLATQQLVHRALRLGSEVTRANADLYATATELTGAMKLVKATAHERQAKLRLSERIDRIEGLAFRNAFDVQIVRAVFEYTSGAAVALLLMAGPLLLGIDVASVLIVVAIFLRLFPRVTALRQCLQSIGLALPAYDRLRAIAEAAAIAREDAAASQTGAPAVGAAAIRLQRVGVAGEGERPVLDDITLDIPAGSIVALVGPTGAGKTSLIDCVLGLMTPSRGDVLIDGLPLGSIGIGEWRRSIGYLGQEPVLFAGSIRDNVLWGRRDCDDAAVAEALHAADAGFVFQLPGGLDCDIAEHGGRLSGGERQRIALARALLGTPRLLVLDEATSALDVETERRIADAVQARRGRVTVLAITHRIGSVRDADLIVMLEQGRIVECGTLAQLQAAQGRFARFWRSQHHEIDAGADNLQRATC